MTQLLWIQWINWMTILVLITSRSWIMEFYQLFLILLETLPRLESQQTSTRWRLFSWMVVQILWHYIFAETWKAVYYFYTSFNIPCWYSFDRRDNFFALYWWKAMFKAAATSERPQKKTTFLIHHSLNWQVVYPKH